MHGCVDSVSALNVKTWAETVVPSNLLRETVAPGLRNGDPIWGTVDPGDPNLHPGGSGGACWVPMGDNIEQTI